MFTRFLTWLNLSSFGYLNITQFLGALNDNIFKLLIVYCFIQADGTSSSNGILAAVGAIYVIPFLLFSQTAGMMADRLSKSRIIVLVKIVEICVMLLGIFAFGFVSKWLAFVGLFMLATHSAIFGPCKYGIVPEIVPQEEISKANGRLTSCTYAAIIIGTFLASFLTDITNRHFVVAALVCMGFSLIGLWASLQIKSTPPAGSQRRATPWFITELFRSFRMIRQEPSLLTAVLGSAYFLFVGSFAQLNIIPFAIEILGFTDVQGGYLFLLTALGIGAGSLLAGKISGRAVELGLVPIGGLGMAICCFLLDYFATNIYCVIPLVTLIGLFGGLYLVPLDSYIQIQSPKMYRGQVVATSNILGFFGVLLSAGALYLFNVIWALPPDRGFSLIAITTLFMVLFIMVSMSGYIVRFCSFIVCRILFRARLQGNEAIPLSQPSIFFIPHSYWPWSMVLLSFQRRRMRLFSMSADPKPNFLGRLARRFLPVTEVNAPDALMPGGEYGDLIAHSLSRGTSIALFCSKEAYSASQETWQLAWKKELDQTEKKYFPAFFVINRVPTDDVTKKRGRHLILAEAIKL